MDFGNLQTLRGEYINYIIKAAGKNIA